LSAQFVKTHFHQRIVCLSTETCEVLYRLGVADRIVGISGFTVHPPQARKEKPRVSAYSSAKIDQIVQLKPDLILAYSDLQADIVCELVKQGLECHVFNQRSIEGILNMIRMLGAIVGRDQVANQLIHECTIGLDHIRNKTSALRDRPKVYFEEWDEPMITAISWVSELINLCGGDDCFAELAQHPDAQSRIIHDPGLVVARAPDLVIGSWCGKRFRPEKLTERSGWLKIPAVASSDVYEIKSANILQPGIRYQCLNPGR